MCALSILCESRAPVVVVCMRGAVYIVWLLDIRPIHHATVCADKLRHPIIGLTHARRSVLYVCVRRRVTNDERLYDLFTVGGMLHGIFPTEIH